MQRCIFHTKSTTTKFTRNVPCRCRYNTLTPRPRHPLELPRTAKPPFSVRIKPYIPTLIWWTIITSIFAHRINLRQKIELDTSRYTAQISILESLISRIRNGDDLNDDDMRREMEMVGLRERTSLTKDVGDDPVQGMNIGWGEALFGRRKEKVVEGNAEEEERKAVQEWTEVLKEVSAPTPAAVPSPVATPPPDYRPGPTRRAPSSKVYM